MTWLLLLLACGAPAPSDTPSDAAGPGPTAPVPVPSTTSPEPTDAETPGTDTGEPTVVHTHKVADGDLKVTFVAVAAQCQADEAWLMAEYLGSPQSIEAVPHVGGVAGTPVELPLNNQGVIRATDATVATSDCAATTWMVTLDGTRRDRCAVFGPDADALLAAHPDCQRH